MNRFLALIAQRGAGMASVTPPASVTDRGFAPFDEVAVEEVRDVATADRLTSEVSPAQARIDGPAATHRAHEADATRKASAVTQPMPVTLAASNVALTAIAAPPLPAVTPSVPSLRRSPLASPAVAPAAPAANPRSAEAVQASQAARVALPAAAENRGAGARRQTKAERMPIELRQVALLRPPPESLPPPVRIITQHGAAIATALDQGRLPPASTDRASGRALHSNGEQPRASRAGVATNTRSPIASGQTPVGPVEVHIGRIEVVQPAAPAPTEQASAPRAIGFDEYARARANGF